MIIGIDLGTTNSLVSVFKDGKCQLIPNALGEFLTPSVVGVDDDGSILVGSAAQERLFTHPDLTTAHFKRLMGTSRTIKLGEHRFRPEELSAMVLRSLKADVEARLGEVTEAVISVPAYFNDLQRTATLAAARMAGLHVERLLNEPTAAAIAFGVHTHHTEGTFLVLDLGGGTFDVSILELFEGVIEIHASAGDNFLGGEDFLQLLVELLLEKLETKTSYDRLGAMARARLRVEAEAIKRALSTQNEVPFSLMIEGQAIEGTLTRKEFEKKCEPLLNRMRTPLERALLDARLDVGALDDVILVGGATRMPIIGTLASRILGRFPRRDVDPDQAIAIGVGLQAALKARNEALGEVVLVDVCPYSLGVAAVTHTHTGMREIFSPIIERNRPIPTSKQEQFFTSHKDQTLIKVQIYQGESRQIENNVLLGELEVVLPKKLPENSPVDIRFTYDINGLLEVEVNIVGTEVSKRTVIKRQNVQLSDEEIDARFKALTNLKLHPREKMENRTLLAKSDRWFSQLLGAERQTLGVLIDQFQSALQTQDERHIKHARKQLATFLSELEGLPLSFLDREAEDKESE